MVGGERLGGKRGTEGGRRIGGNCSDGFFFFWHFCEKRGCGEWYFRFIFLDFLLLLNFFGREGGFGGDEVGFRIFGGIVRVEREF